MLIDGRIEETWEYNLQRSRAMVKTDLFNPHSDQINKSIRAEIERLGRFLDLKVDLVSREEDNNIE